MKPAILPDNTYKKLGIFRNYKKKTILKTKLSKVTLHTYLEYSVLQVLKDCHFQDAFHGY